MRPDWRSPRTWEAVGLIATVLWVAYVAIATGFDTSAPLFGFIFIVPIAGWLLFLVMGRLRVRRRRARGNGRWTP